MPTMGVVHAGGHPCKDLFDTIIELLDESAVMMAVGMWILMELHALDRPCQGQDALGPQKSKFPGRSWPEVPSHLISFQLRH